MNIDELTIGQVKQLTALLSGNVTNNGGNKLGEHLIGKYVIVRTRNEGVNSGYVKALDETGIVLKNARRFYYHRPAEKSQSWYEGVANTGLHKDSKLSAMVEEKVIIEDYSITVCSKEGQKSIEGFPTHEQS